MCGKAVNNDRKGKKFTLTCNFYVSIALPYQSILVLICFVGIGYWEIPYICAMIIDKLKKEITRIVGKSPQTPRDFEDLSEHIYNRTGEMLSPTTLKRLFGYLKEPVKTRVATLHILARFVGYANYDVFCKHAENKEPQSNILLGEYLKAESLEVGELIRLTWLPNRLCIARYLGEGRFEVTATENTKLSVGDTFACHLFINREPLYLNDVVHNNGAPVCFVAGKRDGICVQKLE